MYSKVPSSVRLITTLFVALFFSFEAALRADDSAAGQSEPAELQSADTAVANQDYSAAFHDYLLALQQDPAQQSAVTGCLTVLQQNTPESIDLATLSECTETQLPFDVAYQQTESGPVHSTYKTIFIIPRAALLEDAEDPVENWPFGRSVYVYSTHDGRTADLLCTVHFQSADVADLAHHTGALLSLLNDVYSQRMHASRADDGYPFNVWLCSTAPVSNGGEQWQNNIYFYDVSDQRSSIEWIREIAHEFSHLAFRAIGGTYTSPEAFANGYLGERLLVRWLARGTAGGGPSVVAAWGRTFAGYPNFQRLLITPALADFAKTGLNKAALAKRDEVGMRYMIGMMLDVDDVCGSAAVGSILQSVADQRSSDPNLLFVPVKAALGAASVQPLLKKKFKLNQ